MLVAGLAALAALLIGAAFIRRFQRASRALLQHARAGATGTPPPPGGTGLEEFDQIIDALARARGLQAHAETSLEERTRELAVVLETVPAAVWFTYDPKVKEVRRNKHASHLLKLDDENRASIGSGQLAHFQVYRNGALCEPRDLPLQRAFNEGLIGHGSIAVKFLRRYILPAAAGTGAKPTGAAATP